MVALPFCHFEISAKKTLSKAYPKELTTIGDHIRKRRLDLKMTQRQVAEILGVDESTVWNWESNRTQPLIRHLPSIILFLGYSPLEARGGSLGERLVEYRMQTGLSKKKLARAIGIDPSTLSKLERNNSNHFRKAVKMATDFLSWHDSQENQ